VESTCKREEEYTKSEGVKMVQEIEERETRKKRPPASWTQRKDLG
jgi:hypothetical protein